MIFVNFLSVYQILLNFVTDFEFDINFAWNFFNQFRNNL